MDTEIKKNLARNWFKLLQDSICHDIKNLEKNKVQFEIKNCRKSEDKIVTKTGPKKVKDIQSASGTFLMPINKATIAIAPHIALQA